jgi:sec-independent protein translocase protein TatA
MSHLFGFLGLPAPTQLIVLLVLAVLLFGQNLPQVARSWGQKLAEFRRGMKGIEDQIRSITSEIATPSSSQPTITSSKPQADPNDLDTPTAPKFEPPPG